MVELPVTLTVCFVYVLSQTDASQQLTLAKPVYMKTNIMINTPIAFHQKKARKKHSISNPSHTLRACLDATVPLRSATVSTVKGRSFRFETEGNGPFVWGKGTEPLHPNRLLHFHPPITHYYCGHSLSPAKPHIAPFALATLATEIPFIMHTKIMPFHSSGAP